jgi:hypothetical protein
MMPFAAMHESGYGPSRHVTLRSQTVAFGAKRTLVVVRPGAFMSTRPRRDAVFAELGHSEPRVRWVSGGEHPPVEGRRLQQRANTRRSSTSR